MSILAGSMNVAPRVKLSFERARQHADRRQRLGIDPPTLLLGMVEVEGALSNRILRDLGSTLSSCGEHFRAPLDEANVRQRAPRRRPAQTTGAGAPDAGDQWFPTDREPEGRLLKINAVIAERIEPGRQAPVAIEGRRADRRSRG